MSKGHHNGELGEVLCGERLLMLGQPDRELAAVVGRAAYAV